MSLIAILVTIICCCCCSSSSEASIVNSQGHNANTVDITLPVGVIQRLKRVRDLGVDWLLSQVTEDYGWLSGDTARVVVALASAVEDWPAKNDLVARLIVKQLEIELLEKLLRREIESLTPAKVAFFALAMGAACKDPHNFYGHNLVASLDKHHGDQDFPGYPETFGYSFTSLVSCLAGSHLNNRKTKHLLQISKAYLQKDTASPYYIDTRGIALMALECIRRRKKGNNLSNHMHEPLEAIGVLQKVDGSFGNVHSTAIAIQTLAANSDSTVSWNMTSAALALERSQEPNGSFLNNIVATAESIVAASSLLRPHNVLGLVRGHCNSIRRRRKNKTAIPTSSFHTYLTDEALHQHIKEGESNVQLGNFTIVEKELHSNNNSVDNLISLTTTESTTTVTFFERQALVSLRYWLWIGPHPTTAVKHNLTLQVPCNTTFYSVMQRAAELVADYEFSSTIWPTGHYIHTIAGHHEQPIGYHYWLLYLLRSDPDPEHPPDANLVAPAGVDDLRVEEDQVYLFWYKAI